MPIKEAPGSAASGHFIHMAQQVGGILVHPERPGFLQLLGAVAAGEQAHARRACCAASDAGRALPALLEISENPVTPA